MYPTPIAAESFKWQELKAYGVTDIGVAFKELNKKLSKNEFLTAPSASVAPVLFLMSDGNPTDDYLSGLNELKNNNWYKYAIKVALAIGNDADKNVLKEFTGNLESVITVHTPEALRKWIRKVTVTSTEIGSKSQDNSNGSLKTKQEQFNEQIQNDADLSQEPQRADDF